MLHAQRPRSGAPLGSAALLLLLRVSATGRTGKPKACALVPPLSGAPECLLRALFVTALLQQLAERIWRDRMATLVGATEGLFGLLGLALRVEDDADVLRCGRIAGLVGLTVGLEPLFHRVVRARVRRPIRKALVRALIG